jgi:hypothetical protein
MMQASVAPQPSAGHSQRFGIAGKFAERFPVPVRIHLTCVRGF